MNFTIIAELFGAWLFIFSAVLLVLAGGMWIGERQCREHAAYYRKLFQVVTGQTPLPLA